MPDQSKAVAVTDLSDHPSDPGFWRRAWQALNYAVTGNLTDGWFPPLKPITPVVPAVQQPGVEGRQFDYVIGENIRYTPRSGEAISFQIMRNLAEWDLLAIVIARRKDQLSKLDWSIEPRDKSQRKAKASLTDEVRDWWQHPDQRNTWRDWLMMLLDDLLVLDAPTLYVNRDRIGRIWGFEPIDGATMKPLIDLHGRRPIPPTPAFSQALHGTPAVLYTTDQIIYKPRTLRTWKIYGYSPVEQIIITVNTALRRASQQLMHFTEGNVPEGFYSLPKEWNPKQIDEYMTRFNAMLAGNIAERTRIRFMPDGKYTEIRGTGLKDEFDEWLARLCCAAYGLDPTPFIKQVNRGTQETTREATLAEGLAPYMNWAKELIDECIARQGFPDLEFKWKDDEAIDPVEKSTIDYNKVRSGILHPNEVREGDGLDPLPDETIAWLAALAHSTVLVPPPGTSIAAGGDGQPAPDDAHASGGDGDGATPAAGKGAAARPLGKARASVAPIARDRRLVKEASERIERALTKVLRKMAPDVGKQIAKRLPERAKAASDDDPDDIVDGIDLSAMDALVGAFEAELQDVATDGARLALKQIGVEVDLDLPNERAATWASRRAAELVGKKVDDDGNLTDNPRAKYAITEGTREHLRALVTDAIDEGWSNDTLATNIKGSYAFSASRAELIARTETARADVAGNLIGWKASDVVTHKVWLAAEDCCPECCDLDGVEVALDDGFPDAGDGPPLHPSCRCDISPVVEKEEAAA